MLRDGGSGTTCLEESLLVRECTLKIQVLLEEMGVATGRVLYAVAVRGS